jgi:hypothetical protein
MGGKSSHIFVGVEMDGLPYLFACLILPAVWGWAAAALYDRLEAKWRSRQPSSADDGTEMYYI